MKIKNTKWILGTLATATVVAPLAALVSCSASTSTIDTTSPDTDKVWEGMTVKDLKDKLQKTDDAQTASSNFISQIKYELTESLYNEEQKASIPYQIAFLRYDIYTTEKTQVALAKEIAALKQGPNITSSQIELIKPTTPQANKFYVNDIFSISGNYESNKLLDTVNGLKTDSIQKDSSENDDSFKARKEQFNTKLSSFQSTYKSINTGDSSKQHLLKELVDLTPSTIDSWSGWKSSSLSSNYPKLLKPVGPFRDLSNDELKSGNYSGTISEGQSRIYNEAKAAYIDKYKTSGDGEAEWTKQRSSQYNGATTDDEAVKYLITQQIQTSAFGRFTYALNDSFTIEQYLATYKDAAGKSVHIFPWFENNTLANDKNGLGDKSATPTAGTNPLVWTNDKSEFTKAQISAIDTSNIVDQSDTITPLLANKVFYLGRNSLISNNIIVNLNDKSEEDNFKQNGGSNPIQITHSLIAAKQGTASNLVWTISKDSILSLLEYWGGTTIGSGANEAREGIDMFHNLYSTGHEADTTLYNQYVSDDTGSRTNDGELGVNTYQWYARKGGMNDGFALATMTAYSQQKNDEAQSNKPYDLGNSIGAGDQLTTDLQSKILKVVETKAPDIKSQIDTITSGTKSTAEANNVYSQWINSLTDDNVNNLFGSVFQQVFANRKVAYTLENGKSQNGVHNSFLLASPDSGVHVINITSDASSWEEKFGYDMKNVATENAIAKAKIDWGSIYKSIFTDNNIIYALLKDNKYAQVIKDVVTKDTTLYDQWKKASYIKGDGADDLAKGQEIIDSVNKSIEASRINDQAQGSIDSLTDRIGTYLIGQMDNKFIDPSIDPTKLYDNLLLSLIPELNKP